ncbi:MAG: HD domain-containing protein [Planctomycetota bacterium]
MITHERTGRLLIALASALDHAIDRGISDESVDASVAAFLAELRTAFIESGAPVVSLEMTSSLFQHKGGDLTAANVRARRQIEALRACDAGGLGFGRDTSEREVRQLLMLSIQARDHRLTLQDARQVLVGRGVQSIQLLAANDDYEWAPVGGGPAADAFRIAGFELEIAAPIYRSMAMVVDEATGLAASGHAVDMNAARAVGEQMSRMVGKRYEDLMQLGERPDFDLFTVQHSLRVALMATYVASGLGASPETLTEIGAAGLMHDVGKGRIPAEILSKPGRLDPEERQIIQRHPQLGTEVLLDSPDVSPCALGAAYGHHMRFDGKGYPKARPWAETSKITSLIQVCDVFEALTARRPYKAPYSPARAYRILFADPGAFDPALLAAFTRAMGLFPPGRFVRMSDGRLARVSQVGRALDRPAVRMLPEGTLVDLGAPEHSKLSIVALIEEPLAIRELVELTERSRAEVAALAQAAPHTEQGSSGAANDGDRNDEPVDQSDAAGADDAHCGHGEDCRLC